MPMDPSNHSMPTGIESTFMSMPTSRHPVRPVMLAMSPVVVNVPATRMVSESVSM